MQMLYTSPGTYMWVCPPKTSQVYAIVIGGGGGGAGCPYSSPGSLSLSFGGGGAGGFGIGFYDIKPSQIYQITVGNKGLRGGLVNTSFCSGNGSWTAGSGGTSSFSTFLTCTGGSGGQAYNINRSFIGASGGLSVGHTIYGCTGGTGGGANYDIYSNSNTPTYWTNTGGGGLCGANGGYGNNLAAPDAVVTGGGGMYSNGSAPGKSSDHTVCGASSGINYQSIQGYNYSQTEYASTLFSGSSYQNNPPIDADGKTAGNSIYNMGGCPNITYKSHINPPHLEIIKKIFKLVAGNNHNATGASIGIPTITGGTIGSTGASTNRTQGALLVGGMSSAPWDEGSFLFEYARSGFGCGGGGATVYAGATTNNSRIGGEGGSGLVYLEWN